MGSKFHSEVHTREGVTYLKLGGVIDEDNDLTGLESKLGAGSLVINLSEVDRINSCGVRDWVNWLGRIERQAARPIFVECAPPIVSQINLVSNFTGNGAVKSFYAPYFCPRCEKERLLLLETRDVAQGGPPFSAPSCRCDDCDGPMEFDDMEESYFAFLSNAKKVASDPSVDAVMQEFGTAETTGSGSGSKLRPRGQTGAPPSATTPPSDPQPAAPSEKVGPLPSVPVLAPTRPQTGSPQSTPALAVDPGERSSPGVGKTASTSPGTPIAMAKQLAEEAQRSRIERNAQAGNSPVLAWSILVVLLLTAAGLLAWVFAY